jgi:hypothetical protein
MHPFNADKRGRSRAARSGRVVLSRPSSLQGPSDIPPPVARFLPVSSDLRRAYRRRRTAGTVGLQVQGSVFCLRMPLALPRVLCRCACPFASLQTLAFPKTVVGRRVSRLLGFIPQPDSLSNIRPVLSDEAAPFTLCYGLRIWRAPRAEYDFRHIDGRHRGTMSGQVQPLCYQVDPPPAYTPKKGNWCGNLIADC